MKFLFPQISNRSQFQSILMTLVAATILTLSLSLTIAPAVRFHSWDVELKWKHWLGFLAWMASYMLLHRQVIRKLINVDPFLLPLMGLLSGWGLITIWRLDTILGYKQTMWLSICTLVFIVGLQIPLILSWFQRYKYLLLISGLAITALTIVMGTYPYGEGARLWLGCCGIYIQPSEPLKLLLLVYLAAYLSDRTLKEGFDIKLLLPSLILVAIALGILLIQRDLGTAVIFISLYFIMIYLSCGKRRIIIAAFITILVAAVVGSYLFDIIYTRLYSWIFPWQDPEGQSFQVIQSLLAVAAGGLLGSGLGLGSPGVIPVAHSDFIFSAISEETGMVGAIALILALALLLVRGYKIALNAPNRYLRLLAGGITTYFIIQSVLIIGGNLRLLPLTGVTLPFVSYGGSSLLTSFCAFLFLSIISNQAPEEKVQIVSTQQYLWAGRVLLVLLSAITLVSGWWGFIRSDDLLTRNDNPRRWINDFYVWRGSLLDRNNNLIVITEGDQGTYGRNLLYTPLSPVVGYSNYLYGQAGLENSLDSYLRGIQGSPSSQIWTNRLLYNQTPSGLNVRLSLDLTLQNMIDEAMGEYKGAAVLLNAQTGEILAMASHPYFDSNLLTSKWEEYSQDEDSPLLNRATQGQYSIGTAINPFLLTMTQTLNIELPAPQASQHMFNGSEYVDCALDIENEIDWAQAISKGCPQALKVLLDSLTSEQFITLYNQLGLAKSPEIPLLVAEAQALDFGENDEIELLDVNKLLISPLQMAVAASAFSSEGTCPSPNLAMAVLTSHQGWVILPGKSSTSCLQVEDSKNVAEMMSVSNLPLWQFIAMGYHSGDIVTWYVGGTTPDWQGTPLTLVIVLEEEAPEEAYQMGYQILEKALTPE